MLKRRERERKREKDNKERKRRKRKKEKKRRKKNTFSVVQGFQESKRESCSPKEPCSCCAVICAIETDIFYFQIIN